MATNYIHYYCRVHWTLPFQSTRDRCVKVSGNGDTSIMTRVPRYVVLYKDPARYGRELREVFRIQFKNAVDILVCNNEAE